MDSRRQLMMSSVIKEVFAEILARDGKAIYGKAFVTLTNVKVTSDISLVRFYLSVYNSDNADMVVERFNDHKYELKRKLSERLRHQLRIMPELEFFRDETLDYAFHIDEVLKRVRLEDEKFADVQLKKGALEIAKAKGKGIAAKKPKRKFSNPK